MFHSVVSPISVPAKYHVYHKRHHKKHKKYEKRSPAMGDRDKRQNWVTVQLGRDGKTPMFYLDSKPPPDLLKAQPMILG